LKVSVWVRRWAGVSNRALQQVQRQLCAGFGVAQFQQAMVSEAGAAPGTAAGGS